MMLIGIMMFTWSQSDAMEAQWNKESWTESEIKRIVKLPDEKVIQYWESFWSQIRPNDLYSMKDVSEWEEKKEKYLKNKEKAERGLPTNWLSSEGAYEQRHFDAGGFKNDLYEHIAKMFDTRLEGYNIKSRRALGMQVLRAGHVGKNNMFSEEAGGITIVGK